MALHLSLILQMSLTAVSAETSRVGIFSIGVVGLASGTQQTAIDALATAVAGQPGVSVVSRSELDAMLGAEKLKDLLGCNNVSCLVEAGMAAGVERIISGSLSKLDRALIVSLQLVNVAHANVENRVTLTWSGSIAMLPELLSTAAELLMGTAADRKPGSARLVGLQPTSSVLLDGEPKGEGTSSFDALSVGVHELRIDTPGYETYDAQFLVRSGRTTPVDIRLNEKSTPKDAERVAPWFVRAGGAAAKTLRPVGDTLAGDNGGLINIEAGHRFDSGLTVLAAFDFHGTNMKTDQDSSGPIEQVGGGAGVGYMFGGSVYVMPAIVVDVLRARGKKLDNGLVPAWVEGEAGVPESGKVVFGLLPSVEVGFLFTRYAFGGLRLWMPIVYYPKDMALSAAGGAFVGGCFGN